MKYSELWDPETTQCANGESEQLKEEGERLKHNWAIDRDLGHSPTSSLSMSFHGANVVQGAHNQTERV